MAQSNETKIAFMADVHFSDVFPTIADKSFSGFTSEKGNKKSLIRTMESQLHSTRLFNENYFAFIAALNNAVKREIKIIALPGDFSDDGQPLHVKGLNKILNSYTKNYGISFFIINGNHDPTSPFGEQSGKQDFLSDSGKPQRIISQKQTSSTNLEFENGSLVLEGLKEWGYEEILGELNNHGFFPKENYIYWETPFSNYTYENYNFNDAIEASKLDSRTFSFNKGDIKLPDVSYLVEPVKGIWLLAMDANVYIPKKDGTGFNGSGVGYNDVFKYKRHLIEWSKKIVDEANRLGKTLIGFSHYPMLDFNDGASESIKSLFGVNAFQANRIPDKLVGETFADIGLKLHFGGHMHLNDTGILKTEKGNTLINIQSPSVAAFMPAYKIITIKNSQFLEVETVVLDSVPGYDTFFSEYEKEHDFLSSNFPERAWNKKILSTTSYLEYMKVYLEELIRSRFIPNDWPEDLLKLLSKSDGWGLLALSISKKDLSDKELESIFTSDIDINYFDYSIENLQKELDKKGLSKSDFKAWSGFDLMYDFYMFKNADELALRVVDTNRLKCYDFLFELLLNNDKCKKIASLKQFATIFKKQLIGEPSSNFSIDLEKGKILKN
jgi:hypothetical protein